MRVDLTRIAAFVISALSAVTAGIMLGGFAGVSTDVGQGLELQAIAACVIGGAQLMGGRGTVVGVVAGALSLFALFTLLEPARPAASAAGYRARPDPDLGRRFGRLSPKARRVMDGATVPNGAKRRKQMKHVVSRCSVAALRSGVRGRRAGAGLQQPEGFRLRQAIADHEAPGARGQTLGAEPRRQGDRHLEIQEARPLQRLLLERRRRQSLARRRLDSTCRRRSTC